MLFLKDGVVVEKWVASLTGKTLVLQTGVLVSSTRRIHQIHGTWANPKSLGVEP